MALKPTIFKMSINYCDLDNDIYNTLALTVAQHPSENLERMMARVLAFSLNEQEFLSFTKGLSNVDDPDIWAKSLSDEFLLWIDMGEPAFERIKKASRQAKSVKIYSFNSKSPVWWKQNEMNLSKLKNLDVYQFNFQQIQDLAKLVERTMSFTITNTSGTCYISTALGDCEVFCDVLQSS